MKIHGIRSAAVLTALAAAAALAGCAATDTVGKFAASSFASLAEASRDRISYEAEDGAWALASPAGDLFLLSSDFARNAGSGGMADMDRPDAELSLDAAPFLAAGLDVAKIPAAEGIKYELEDGRFMLHFELGKAAFAPAAKDSMTAAFGELLKAERARVSYHAALDHYGIMLGGGNMVEWAKDLSKNDKDLVFVLEPGPLVAAGLDPAKVEGWVFAKVETMDAKGKKLLVDKLLRPFELR
ncbi:MAG TPA: hypothetical protein P5165_01820 [Spirochaetia bacterium]|nr:hypothetical protein [Spirochaetales bacterium]HRY71936.1 hypothetical protein [Spirochaetia bacterium]